MTLLLAIWRTFPAWLWALAASALIIAGLGFALADAHRTIGEKNEALRTAALELRKASTAIQERDDRLREFARTERGNAEANAIQCSDSVTQAFNRGVAAGRAVCQVRP